MNKPEKRIAVLSDTHGLLRPEVKEVLNTCDTLIHGGDINRQAILDELSAYGKLYVVRGNNDKEWAAGLPEQLSFEIAGFHFIMIHNKKQLKDIPEETDIVIYGHTHKYEEKRVEGRLFLNPGSCGPRRFHQPVTMAVLTLWEEEGRCEVEKLVFTPGEKNGDIPRLGERDMRKLVESIRREMESGRSVQSIAKRNGVTEDFAEQVMRIYVTHPGVDTDGILNRMEVRGMLGEKEDKARS